MTNLIDFHVHGNGSYFKDKFANASYEQMCEYFQRIAEQEGRTFTVAFTEHDNVKITYEEFKRLREKYPNVKIVLGMESNAKLNYSTNGVFERAHILTYADMSSEEGIKKWFECKELQAISKINTFEVKYPTPFMRVESFLDELNSIFSMKLNSKKFARLFEKSSDSRTQKQFRNHVIGILAKELFENKDKLGTRAGKFFENIRQKKGYASVDEITFENIKDKLDEIQSAGMNMPAVNRELGGSLYILKNNLDKYLNIRVSNQDLLFILNEAKSVEQMRREFLIMMRYKIQKYRPDIFERIKDFSLEKLADYKLGFNKYGQIKLSSFFPDNYRQEWIITKQKFNLRTRLSELNTIAQKTGGHLVLAHPNSVFSYSDNGYLTKKDFDKIDKTLMSKSMYKAIENKFKEVDRIPVSSLKSFGDDLIKLDLFFNICKSKGINFDGFEITKSNLNTKKDILLNKLIYAAKHDLEVSFGSDTHVSKIQHYFNLLREGKISQEVFDKKKKELSLIGDTTAADNSFKDLYGSNFRTHVNYSHEAEVIEKPKRVVKPMLKNSTKIYYTAKDYGKVLHTSFAEKVFNKNLDEDNRSMFTLEVDDTIYNFDKKTLKETDYYNRQTMKVSENKNEDKEENAFAEQLNEYIKEKEKKEKEEDDLDQTL